VYDTVSPSRCFIYLFAYLFTTYSTAKALIRYLYLNLSVQRKKRAIRFIHFYPLKNIDKKRLIARSAH